MRKIEILRKGFTLIELLLTIALITILSAITIPIFESYQVGNDLRVAEETAVQALRRAQLLAQATEGDSTWGVSLATGSVTLFKGTSFAARDTNFDEAYSISSSIVLSGLSELVFAKLTGFPSTTGTITFTSTLNNTEIITLNAKGVISY